MGIRAKKGGGSIADRAEKVWSLDDEAAFLKHAHLRTCT